LFFISLREEPRFRFFLLEECPHSLLQSFKDQMKLPANRFIALGEFVSDDPEWTASAHLEFLKQLDMRSENPFQIAPRLKPAVEPRCAGLYI